MSLYDYIYFAYFFISSFILFILETFWFIWPGIIHFPVDKRGSLVQHDTYLNPYTILLLPSYSYPSSIPEFDPNSTPTSYPIQNPNPNNDPKYVTRSGKTRNKGHLWHFQLLISSEPLQTKL